MKKTILLLFIIVLGISFPSFAQVKIGDNPTTINPGSALEVESTNKGFLLPRIALTNTTTWSLQGTPVAGMQVYNTNLSLTSTNTAYPTLAAKIGQYYWDGTGWVALAPLTKSTAIYTFPQSAGVIVPLPVGAGLCSSFNCAGNYSKYLNWTGTFTTLMAVNDVVLDLVGSHSVANSTAGVSFQYWLTIQATGGTETGIANFFVTETASSCLANTFNYKTVLQNLAPTTYTVRVYASPWGNTGTTAATLGVGSQAQPGCGGNNPSSQKLVVTVSQ